MEWIYHFDGKTYIIESKPQPHYDFELAKICQWLKKNKMTMHVSLKGDVYIKYK